MKTLECEDHLKVDATIRGLGSTASAGTAEEPTQRVRLAKQVRAHSPDPRSEVHVIKEISGVGAEREIIAPIAVGSPAEHPALAAPGSAQPAWSKAAANATTAPTTTRATIATVPTPRGCPPFDFLPEANSFAQPKVKGELPGILEVIGGQDGLGGRRKGIEGAERRRHDVGTRSARCGECRTGIEGTGPEQVLA